MTCCVGSNTFLAQGKHDREASGFCQLDSFIDKITASDPKTP